MDSNVSTLIKSLAAIAAPQSALPAAFHESRMLSRKQVQEMLGIKKAAFFRLLKNKKDPFPRYKIGGRLKFKLDKVIWWIEKQEQ